MAKLEDKSALVKQKNDHLFKFSSHNVKDAKISLSDCCWYLPFLFQFHIETDLSLAEDSTGLSKSKVMVVTVFGKFYGRSG